MAKPVSKRIKKRIRGGMKKIEKTVDDLTSDHSAGKIAGVAAAGLVGVAGVAAAVTYFRDKGGKAALRVTSRDGTWVLSTEGSDQPLGIYDTKKQAVTAARAEAHRVAPSRLVIHRLDGTIQASHDYEPS